MTGNKAQYLGRSQLIAGFQSRRTGNTFVVVVFVRAFHPGLDLAHEQLQRDVRGDDARPGRAGSALASMKFTISLCGPGDAGRGCNHCVGARRRK